MLLMPRRPTGSWAKTVFWSSLMVTVLKASASFADCDLSPLELTDKQSQVMFGSVPINIAIGGKLTFECTGAICTTLETTYARLADSETAINNILAANATDLPNERCGSRVNLGRPRITSSGGTAEVLMLVQVEQWGCALGIAAKLAYGTFQFRVTYTPVLSGGRLNITQDITNSGSLASTIPDIDSETSRSVNEKLENATSEIVSTVKEKLKAFASQLDALLSQQIDPTNGQPLYRPVDKSAYFSSVATSLTLTRQRSSVARQGSTCTIRRIAPVEWDRVNF